MFHSNFWCDKLARNSLIGPYGFWQLNRASVNLFHFAVGMPLKLTFAFRFVAWVYCFSRFEKDWRRACNTQKFNEIPWLLSVNSLLIQRTPFSYCRTHKCVPFIWHCKTKLFKSITKNGTFCVNRLWIIALS